MSIICLWRNVGLKLLTANVNVDHPTGNSETPFQSKKTDLHHSLSALMTIFSKLRFKELSAVPKRQAVIRLLILWTENKDECIIRFYILLAVGIPLERCFHIVMSLLHGSSFCCCLQVTVWQTRLILWISSFQKCLWCTFLQILQTRVLSML